MAIPTRPGLEGFIKSRLRMTMTVNGDPRFTAWVGIPQSEQDANGNWHELEPQEPELVLFGASAQATFAKFRPDTEQRSSGVQARARWTDLTTKKRITRAQVVPSEEAAEAFFDTLRRSVTVGIDLTVRLTDYIHQIGDRWKRGLDPTFTATGYWAGLRLRVIPAMGHVPVASISTGMIDRTIDD